MSGIRGRDKIKNYIRKYASSGLDYFTLKNDGDAARVRFLHSDDNDLEIRLVHRLEVEGKQRYVECIEDDCPLCATVGRPQLKLFIILFDYADEKIKCWERGVTLVDYLFGFMDKYGHLNNRDYEIQRHGKKGDTKTTYQLFSLDKGPMLGDGDKPLEFSDTKGNKLELPERPEIVGRFVFQWSREEMQDHIADTQPIDRKRGGGQKDTALF